MSGASINDATRGWDSCACQANGDEGEDRSVALLSYLNGVECIGPYPIVKKSRDPVPIHRKSIPRARVLRPPERLIRS